MASYSDLKLGLTKLGLTDSLVIAHTSLRAFGPIEGGAETMLQILLASVRGVIMPAFTYKTMITPEVGPPNNGLTYGREQDLNKMAEPFHPDIPADPTIGFLPELLRNHYLAKRTLHPIQSFAGVNADSVLNSQTIYNPLAPIAALAEQDGWVLLLGVDHTVNTSIHYAEKLAGRRQFVRWALTRDRIVECPGFPGDSAGFNSIADDLGKAVRRVEIGDAIIQAIPLKELFGAVINRIKQDPQALLCQLEDCKRCEAIRNTKTIQ
ncbi:MAG: AAC(3) family N-acetyltransferase [Chloroflexi bacterium]|nr:AAC(3) family N-acetyltransferase [Chloroflexota bacterium]